MSAALYSDKFPATPAMPWTVDDGGRAAAGFKGSAGDCAVRAVTITTGLAYKDVYAEINRLAQTHERTGKRKRTISNARTGVHRVTMHRLLTDLGATWVSTMGIGTGCTVHVRADELPAGRLILNLSKHFAAVIDGVLHDTHDCSREGTRCVYGYWIISESK